MRCEHWLCIVHVMQRDEQSIRVSIDGRRDDVARSRHRRKRLRGRRIHESVGRRVCGERRLG